MLPVCASAARAIAAFTPEDFLADLIKVEELDAAD
jgi:hypothetical protein